MKRFLFRHGNDLPKAERALHKGAEKLPRQEIDISELVPSVSKVIVGNELLTFDRTTDEFGMATLVHFLGSDTKLRFERDEEKKVTVPKVANSN